MGKQQMGKRQIGKRQMDKLQMSKRVELLRSTFFMSTWKSRSMSTENDKNFKVNIEDLKTAFYVDR